MNPEIPQLGSGSKPADPAVWGTDYTVLIEKERQERPHNNPDRSHLIPEAGCINKLNSNLQSHILYLSYVSSCPFLALLLK